MGRKERKTQAQARIQKKEMRKQLFRQLSPLLWTFVAWFAITTIMHLPAFSRQVQDFFVHFTTVSAYWFGKIFFLPVKMYGVPYLSVNGFQMEVITECTAYNFYVFGAMLVVFARWPIRHKIVNFGIILVSIFILNNLRFISMGYVGSFRPELFDLVHDYAWNILFGFLVFGIWAWRETAARKAIRGRELHAAPDPASA
jgi:exosortase/archaeosortase family protein